MDGAPPPPQPDADMTDATPSPTHPSQQQQQQQISIPATLTYGGRFIQYNIFGNLFEVTSKYKPPIMPIGKGAYGIVCSALNSETNEHVAIKKIANAFDNKVDAKRTLREIKLLRHMDHENVVAIRDIIPPSRREAFNDRSRKYDEISNCVEYCSAPVIHAKNLVEGEMAQFQERLQRSLMVCQDKYESSKSNLGHQSYSANDLESCVNQSMDDGIKTLPHLVAKLERSLGI